jgi:hypothetical protein
MTPTVPNSDEILGRAVFEGLRDGVTKKMDNYNSPLEKLVNEAINKHSPAFRALLEDAVGGAIGDPAFQEEIKTAARTQLAKILVQRYGGELEKQVNALKSDPLTRAKITLALDEIIKSAKTS